MTEIQEPCKSCGGGCCNKFAVYLTVFDIMRIADAYGLQPKEFTKRQERKMVRGRWAPSFFLFDLNGGMKDYIICIMRKKNEHCIFYRHEKGCGIYENRPLVCRAYPFLIDEDGGLDYLKPFVCWREWEEDEVDKEGFMDVILRHCDEIRDYGKITRKWNSARRVGKGFEEYLEFCLNEARNLSR